MKKIFLAVVFAAGSFCVMAQTDTAMHRGTKHTMHKKHHTTTSHRNSMNSDSIMMNNDDSQNGNGSMNQNNGPMKKKKGKKNWNSNSDSSRMMPQ